MLNATVKMLNIHLFIRILIPCENGLLCLLYLSPFLSIFVCSCTVKYQPKPKNKCHIHVYMGEANQAITMKHESIVISSSQSKMS